MRRPPEWLGDAWVPALLTGLAVAEVSLAPPDVPVGSTALLSVMVPQALVTGARRRAPALTALAVGVLTGVLVLGVLPSVATQPPLNPFLVLLVTLFNLGLRRHEPWVAPVSVLSVIGLATMQVGALVAGQPLGDVVPSTLFLAGALVLGMVVGTSRRQAEEQRARAESAERDREAHTAAAVAEERSRIARELHDVIAHALTGIVVEAGVEARLQSEATDHGKTLRSIERRGREAMVELRRLLGLLREDGQGPADAPLPSLAAAEELVESVRRAGHEVDLVRAGDLDGVPPALQLAAYRIVQEALTNVTRHAPGSTVEVRLCRERDRVEVLVTNGPGSTSGPGLDRGGHGLAGMRERVRVYGGELVAAPTATGGFRVEARLPLLPEVATP